MEDLIIIGSGPAGYTAAIYAARANLKPLLISGYEVGGQLMLTSDVENYPGFPEGIMGPDLMALFRKQSERFGTRFLTKNVTGVDISQSGVLGVELDQERMETRALIVATGASARWLGLESEQKLLGKGVSSCATCDGAFFRDEELVLVGGGDSAMEEAMFLTKFATKVTVIHRRDTLKASKIMQDRAMKNPKIEFLWNSEVIEVLGQDKVEGVRVRNVENSQEHELSCAGFFLAIGHIPNTKFLRGKVDMDESGYIKLPRAHSTMTNVPGLFSAGDVHDTIYRQAITAAGSGCQAALDAERYLEALGH